MKGRSIAIAVAVSFITMVGGFGSAANANLLWDWSWSGNGNTASGTLTTNNLSAGSYLITAATGTWDGLPITGLAPINSCCAFGGPANDNLLLSGFPQLDLDGFTFDIAGDEINLFYDTQNGPAGYYLLDQAGIYAPGQVIVGGMFSATQVPEPASLTLLGTALAGLGLIRRRKRV